MASSPILIPLLVAVTQPAYTVSEVSAAPAPDANLICEEFVEESKAFSTQPSFDLIAASSALSKAADMKVLEGLFDRDFERLIQTYTVNGLSIKQAEAEMLGDLKS
ncbi:hypothetical protein [Aeromonas hydrophila]|uniref:hypothetical protein n=1 Tax=Aeromonas hydrophila TaxID=644 RepID=UPI0020A102EB|nr:hypothetical protein [Aeromonas hydrophila]MCP1268863.1 hypothetical protein [Aeromonas hydrophila]MCP1297414.1 hypothetical protein [Aeromonas hydrophila]